MQFIDFTSADRIMSEGHTSKGDQPKWKQSGNWYKADHMGYEALSENNRFTFAHMVKCG